MKMGMENLFYFSLLFILYLPLANTSMEVTYEEAKQTCPYFYDHRFAVATHGLVNCSWYSHKACCKRTEVTSVFSNMYPLFEASKKCANMMNYLMCYFCSPEQHMWYKQKARVCSDFCLALYEECKTAFYNGKQIVREYMNGSEFCEAQDFSVVDSNCFKFNPKVFDGAVQHMTYFIPFISSIIMVIIAVII